MIIKEGMEPVRDEFVFSKELYESKTSPRKGVLRTIKGPVAEWGSVNRNNRKYSEKLWDKVLDSDYVKEQTENKSLYGEANHPADRFDVDFERVSHSIVEMYKVPEKNQIYATIDILDTPLGNILNVLYEYGSVLGYSSRAGGVLHNKKTHIEVDENSYQFVTFDAVPYPSVVSARPLNESGEPNICEKVEISEEAHTKIIQIIEAFGEKGKEVLKDFIYSLQDYNLDKELAVLEGLSTDKDESDLAETLKSTTLCLLKESYKQINNLKYEKSNVERQLTETTTKTDEYKSKLGSALKKIESLSEGSKTSGDALGKVDAEVGKLKSTVKDLSSKNGVLLNTIRDYEESIEEMELKVLEIEIMQNDLEKQKIILEGKNKEIKNLTSMIDDVGVEKTKLLEEIESYKRFSDYEEVNEELGTTVKEITSLKENYTFNVEKLTKKESELERISEDLTRTIESLEKANINVEKITYENADLLEAISSYRGETLRTIENLELLSDKVIKLDEQVKFSEDKLKTCKFDLIRSVCGQYGVDPKNIEKKLFEDFTSADVHILCESESSNKKFEVISISEDIVITPESQEDKIKEDKKERLSGMLSTNRRGKLIK